MACRLRRLTALGRGAVAVIEVCTDEPESRIDAHFAAANKRQPSAAPINRILYGAWLNEDVVVVRTAKDTWEVHCHGGDAAVARIADSIGGKFASREISSATDHIHSLVQQSRTPRTANYLLSQLDALPTWRTEYQAANQSRQAELLNDLTKWQSFADHLTVPWQVAIIGKPNAGKSSLLNAVVGFDRAIVYEQPGTTRDRVAAEIILEGWPVNLIDTAGIRSTTDTVERIGVKQAIEAMQSCDACLFLKDASQPWSEDDQQLLNEVPADTPFAMINNKSDLERHSFPPVQVTPTFDTVATTGHGVDEILKWIPHALIPEIPPPSTPLPVVEIGSLLADCR